MLQRQTRSPENASFLILAPAHFACIRYIATHDRLNRLLSNSFKAMSALPFSPLEQNFRFAQVLNRSVKVASVSIEVIVAAVRAWVFIEKLSQHLGPQFE